MIRADLPGRGRVIQLAFVPRDFHGALRFWIERLGVGLGMDPIRFDSSRTNRTGWRTARAEWWRAVPENDKAA